MARNGPVGSWKRPSAAGAVLLELGDRVVDEIDDEGPLHAVVVDAAAYDVAFARRRRNEPNVAALPARQQTAGHRPLIVVPALGLVGVHRRGIDQPADDRLAADVLQLELVLAFQRRVGVQQHVAVGVEDEDVRLAEAPAAAVDTEVAERRFTFRGDEIRRVVHEHDERTSVFVLVGLIGDAGGGRVGVRRAQNQ